MFLPCEALGAVDYNCYTQAVYGAVVCSKPFLSIKQCSWTVGQRDAQLASALLMCDCARGHNDIALNVQTMTKGDTLYLASYTLHMHTFAITFY